MGTEIIGLLLIIALMIGLVIGIERLRAQRDTLLQQKEVVLSFMHDIADVFTRDETTDVASLLQRVVFYAVRTTGARAGALYLSDESGEALQLCASVGVMPPIVYGVTGDLSKAFSKIREVEAMVRGQVARKREGLVGTVAETGRPILIADAALDDRVPRFAEDFLKVSTVLLVPLRLHNAVPGVVVVVNRVDDTDFTEAHMNLLQALADQAAVSVRHAQRSAAMEAMHRLSYDLSIASQIQQALLPREIPRVPGVDIAAFCVSAQQIGGDYYDIIRIDDGHVGIVVADVSGKGIAAGLIMAMCRSVLRSEAHNCLDPAVVLRRVNATLKRDVAEDMFISVLYMIVSPAEGTLRVARAGHPQPALTPARRGDPRLIQSDGMAIGMADADLFDQLIEAKVVSLASGDMVVAYTDGITEAHDVADNEWGLLNFLNVIQSGSQIDELDAEGVARAVRRKLMDFIGERPQYDDMTMVVMKYTKQTQG